MIDEFKQDFIQQTEVGEGGNSIVYKSIYVKTKTCVALKESQLDPEHPEDLMALKNEIDIHKTIDYPLIAQFFSASYTNNISYVSLEFAGEKTLLEYINTNKCLTEDQARKFFIQIVSSLQYLHNQKHYLHCDIKPENVMIDSNENAILIDFGLCTPLGSANPGFGGTPAYTAPEILLGQADALRTGASDIWSAGIILYIMLFNRLPFDSSDESQFVNDIKTKDINFHGMNISDDAEKLLLRLLEKDPSTRITIPEIAVHPWISKSVYSNLLNPIYTDQPSLRIMPTKESEIDEEILTELLQNLNEFKREDVIKHLMAYSVTKDVMYYKIKKIESLKKQLNEFRRAHYRPPREIPLTFLAPFPIPSLTQTREYQKLTKF